MTDSAARRLLRGAEGPPLAPTEPTAQEQHGVRRVDEFAWLRDSTSPRALAYLRAERDYYDRSTARLAHLRDSLRVEMSARLPAVEESASWPEGSFAYRTRIPEGEQYEQLLRRPQAGGPEQVVLDGALLAAGSDYFELGIRLVSPDGRLVAYSVDTVGDEVYALRFRDLQTGEDLPEEVPRTYYGGAWSADSSVFFYVVHDAAYRPYQVWRHRVGADPASDVLVLQEDDERFEVTVGASRSGSLGVIEVFGRDTNEAHLLDLHRPEQPPRLVDPRREGIEYRVTHAPGPEGDDLLVVTNDTATEFRLCRAPLATPGRAHWSEVIAENPRERLVGADVFARHVVLSLRRGGSPLLRVLRRDGADWAAGAFDVLPGLAAGTIRLEHNEVFDATEVQVAVESYSEPAAWYSVDLETGARSEVWRAEVPTYDPSRFRSERRFVPARDGVAVPVTLVHRADVPLDGSAPCLMYGYGAYEYSFEPEFDRALISLLDRGVVFAHAHVRGGGELGRAWWLEGRLGRKERTFDDFVDVADALADGVVDGHRIAARGLSAGGLLAGAVYSRAPRRWRGVVAEVPFVDVVTTMLDASAPLTAQEWQEWGDPRRTEDFAWLAAYSPYENLPPLAERPGLLVTGALHDPRVMVCEPAKWVARLRASGSVDDRVLFRVETGAGSHGGPSGRLGQLAYEAEVQAWVLDVLGAG